MALINFTLRFLRKTRPQPSLRQRLINIWLIALTWTLLFMVVDPDKKEIAHLFWRIVQALLGGLIGVQAGRGYSEYQVYAAQRQERIDEVGEE